MALTTRRTRPTTEVAEVGSDDLSTEELSPPAAAAQHGLTLPPRREVQLTSQEDSFLQKLITSRQLPGHVTTVEQAFTIGKMGKELGFPIMQAFHWIIPIQGKLTLAARAIGGLMRKHGVTMKTLEDGLYIYRNGDALEYPRTVVTPDDKPIDRRTTILFTRDGIEEKVSFTWIDATNQELVSKSNWKKMPK